MMDPCGQQRHHLDPLEKSRIPLLWYLIRISDGQQQQFSVVIGSRGKRIGSVGKGEMSESRRVEG